MRGFMAVFKRELHGYFTTPVAYVFLVIFLVASSSFAGMSSFYEVGEASMMAFFNNMPMLFIFLAPAIAMRLWAEERKSNSIELLFTLPITTPQAVLGKFFAALSVMILALVLTAPMVYTVYSLGNPDSGPIVSGYIASALLSAAYLAVGSFFSSLTRNQVIAFVLSVAACGMLLYADSPSVMEYLSGWLPKSGVYLVESLSLRGHFESMIRGVVELRDLAFFVLACAGVLWANMIVVTERKAD